MAIALATLLKEGTKKSHTMAENTGFVSCFLKGVVEKSSYRKLVSDLYFVYGAMEEEMAKLKDHPVVGPIVFDELNRKQSLVADLTYYYGEAWASQVEPSASAKVYVDRIHQVASQQPELLVAHAYTRYMGDLSGGQILKTIAQKALDLGDRDGVNFYNFDTIEDEKAFKAMYRAKMNSLPIDEAAAERIVEEANHAFGLNMHVFKELEGNLIVAIGKTLFGFLTSRQRAGSTEGGATATTA